MSIELKKPALAHFDSYLNALLAEMHSGMGPLAQAAIETISQNPERFIERLTGPQPLFFEQKDDLLAPWIKTSWLWSMEGDLVVGMVTVRHGLNDFLRRENGNIGHGVRPGWEGRGIGTSQLALALAFFGAETVREKALVCCHADNVASRKIIEKNGGRLFEAQSVAEEPPRTILRFWVPAPGPRARLDS